MMAPDWLNFGLMKSDWLGSIPWGHLIGMRFLSNMCK
ncbi:unnamed protein product, partial [Rotaria magnacalcarata]